MLKHVPIMSRIGSLALSTFVFCGFIAVATEASAHSSDFAKSDALVLPLNFSSFKDDPQLAPYADNYSAGTPAFDSSGVEYYRLGKAIIRIDRDGRRVIDQTFGSDAVAAINRDLFAGGSWDQRWDYGQMVDDRLVFDQQNRVYTIITPRYSNLKSAVLLYSEDHMHSWSAIALKGRAATLEIWDSFNSHSGPPTVLSYDSYGALTGTSLWLERFSFGKSGLERQFSPQLVADDSLLGPNHSGGANSSFTVGNKIFIVYPSTQQSTRGSKIFLREFDLALGEFVGPAMYLGVAGDISPLNQLLSPDPHCVPAITADRNGRLNVIFGAHHGMLKMTSSLNPLTGEAWTTPRPIGQPLSGGRYGSYTYVSLLTDLEQNIHIFARAEGDGYRFQLVQMKLAPDGSLKRWGGGLLHRVIAEPGRSFYAAWRQKAVFDQSGRIYLHLKYWPDQLTTSEAQQLGVSANAKSDCRGDRCTYSHVPFLYPTTLVSADWGETFHVLQHGTGDTIDSSEN